MTTKDSVFEKTYKYYIAQVAGIDFKSIEQKLVVEVEGNEVIIPLFGKPHRVSEIGITDPPGKQPSLVICVILLVFSSHCLRTFSHAFIASVASSVMNVVLFFLFLAY